MTIKNNEITLYNGGKEAFPRIIERIEKADKSIVLAMFVWRDDKIGNQIAEKLLEASKRGVTIHIIKDKLGMVFELAEERKKSLFHKEFDLKLMIKAMFMDMFYPMEGKGKFHKQTKSPIYNQLTNSHNITVDKDNVRSDHSKYYIFDDSTLIMGGMNIEDKSIYTDVEGKEYIDFMI
ncbi:MAG: phosphatidylserine/phosphatidylglycerophosphate/cardiolipin synthase family protein, partial [Tissierellia bacterium]|nr:phosphatidylserine/phosphatidylglycerophosphate/cardiolipin synthase family protein [Tissierellia bacterium]